MGEDEAGIQTIDFNFKELLSALEVKQQQSFKKKIGSIKARLGLLRKACEDEQPIVAEATKLSQEMVSKLERVSELQNESIKIQKESLSLSEEIEKLESNFDKILSDNCSD